MPSIDPTVIAGGSYIQCPAVTASKAGWSGWVGVLAGFCFAKEKREALGGPGGTEEWGYPDIISWNGTNYTDERRNDLIYRDDRDNMLDLKQWS